MERKEEVLINQSMKGLFVLGIVMTTICLTPSIVLFLMIFFNGYSIEKLITVIILFVCGLLFVSLIILGLIGMRYKVIFTEQDIEIPKRKQKQKWSEIKEIGIIKYSPKIGTMLYFSTNHFKDDDDVNASNSICVMIEKRILEILPWILSHYDGEIRNKDNFYLGAKLKKVINGHGYGGIDQK